MESSLKIDLHVHDKNSYDSISTLKRIIKCAKKRKLDGIAITNHNKFVKYPKEVNGILIISGEEVETDKGDLIGLFLEKEIKSRKFEEVVKEIKQQGGIVVLPHPKRGHEKVKEEDIAKVDCIEVSNGRSKSVEYDKDNRKLAIKLNKCVTGGSDAHFSFEVGNCYTIIYSRKEHDEIKKALRNKRTKAVRIKRSTYLTRLLSKMIKKVKKWKERYI